MPLTRVRVCFGQGLEASQELQVDLDAITTLKEAKERIAAAAGGSVTADDLLLSFGPSDRKMGRQYRGDPAVDEVAMTLGQFSALDWIARFPSWGLSVSLLPAAPPPPGVAVQRAAATAEGKDPDRAVQDARGKGEIPRIADLPAPWGPKPSVPLSGEAAAAAGYLPPSFPGKSRPAVDVSA